VDTRGERREVIKGKLTISPEVASCVNSGPSLIFWEKKKWNTQREIRGEEEGVTKKT